MKIAPSSLREPARDVPVVAQAAFTALVTPGDPDGG